MKKTGVFIILLFFAQILHAQEYMNNIGLNFLGTITTIAPKHNLPGNNENSFMDKSNNLGSSFGLYYERFLKNGSSSLESGIYYNRLFYYGEVHDLREVSVPINFNGDIFGKRRKTRLFFGYTAGLDLNFLAHDKADDLDNMLTGADAYVYPKKYFYVAPHAGINTGVNFWNMSLSFRFLFHFFVPEYLTFKTVYENDQGKEITEYNTNKSWGTTFRVGLSYRF